MNFNELLDIVSSYVFGLICHQNTSILVEAQGQYVMLCPRCSGLHIGFFACVLLAFIVSKGKLSLKHNFSKIFCLLAFLMLASEWLLAQQNIIQSTTESRFITGLLAGCAFGLLTLAYRSYYVYAYVEKTNGITLLAIILTTLLLGIGLSQLSDWRLITFLLLIMVLSNLAFIVHSIVIRVYFVITQNHKTYPL